MLRKLGEFILQIMGALFGGITYYGIMCYGDDAYRKAGVLFRDNTDLSLLLLFVISFAVSFKFLAPDLFRGTTKAAARIGQDSSKVSPGKMIACTLGVILGMVIALLLSMTYRSLLNSVWYAIITLTLYVLCGYVGFAVGMGQSLNVEQIGNRIRGDSGRMLGKIAWRETPKIFDTSVVIDGRIIDVIRAGFLEGPFIVPDFVLAELHLLSDSANSLKRTRGRRGLELLANLQDEFKITIYSTKGKKEIEEIPEVDVKLVKLSRSLNGKLVTNDFNLNRVAHINDVRVLNINDLANAIKPVVMAGEPMLVDVIKRGKNENQGIGYLDDGTMIVVEDGADQIGKSVKIRVTSVIQTSAGKMIFGRRNASEDAENTENASISEN